MEIGTTISAWKFDEKIKKLREIKVKYTKNNEKLCKIDSGQND